MTQCNRCGDQPAGKRSEYDYSYGKRYKWSCCGSKAANWVRSKQNQLVLFRGAESLYAKPEKSGFGKLMARDIDALTSLSSYVSKGLPSPFISATLSPLVALYYLTIHPKEKRDIYIAKGDDNPHIVHDFTNTDQEAASYRLQLICLHD